MAFLGFDPDGVIVLRIAIRQAVDDLEQLHRAARNGSSDGAAIVQSVIADARSTLVDRWLPRLDALSHALIGQPHPLAASALDPTAPAGFVTLDATADDIFSRTQQLSAARLVLMLQMIGEADDGLAGQLQAIDRDIERLADWLGRSPGPLTADGYPAVLDRLDPYAAALVLRHLHLTGTALAAACAQTLRRWHDPPPTFPDPRAWSDTALAGENTGDVLFALLIADQHAAQEFVTRCADRPEVVLLSVGSPRTLAALLEVAIPTDLDPAAAGAIIRPLARWTFTEGVLLIPDDDPDIADPRSIVAAATTPWLPWFGPRAEEFGWTSREGYDTLLSMCNDREGGPALADALGTWTEKIRTEPLIDDDGNLDSAVLDDLAATTVLIQHTISDSAIDRAARERALMEFALDTVQSAVSLLTPGGRVASRAFSVAETAGREGAERLLVRSGLMPAPADEVRAEQAESIDQSTSAITAAAVVAMVDRLVELDRLPPDSVDIVQAHLDDTEGCRSRGTADQLRAAIRQLDASPSDRHLLDAVVFAFSNSGSEWDICGP